MREKMSCLYINMLSSQYMEDSQTAQKCLSKSLGEICPIDRVYPSHLHKGGDLTHKNKR